MGNQSTIVADWPFQIWYIYIYMPDTGDPVVTVRNHGGIFRIDVDPVDGALFILHGSTVSQWGPPPKFRCDHLLAKKEGPPRGSGGSGGSGWLWAPPVSENEGLGTGQFKRAHSCQFLNLKSFRCI